MAKIRVHELAKELNITNKAILTKLKAMNIEVKSHMSSLEDETVEYIKMNILGEKKREGDSKVATSVIRRRKKNRADFKDNASKEPAEALKESIKNVDVVVDELQQTIRTSDESAQNVISVDENIGDNQVGISDTASNEDGLKNYTIGSDMAYKNRTQKAQEVKITEANPDAPMDLKNEASRGDKDQTNQREELKDIEYQADEKLDSDVGSAQNIQNVDSQIDNNNDLFDKSDEQNLRDQQASELLQEQESQEGDDSQLGDKKKRRKKKQKRSEPAKIIKLAEPVPPPVPVVIPSSSPTQKRRDYVDKNVKHTSSSDKEKGYIQRDRASVYNKEKPSLDRDNKPSHSRAQADSSSTIKAKGGSDNKDRAPSSYDKARTQPDKDRAPSSYDKARTQPDKDRAGSPSGGRGGNFKPDTPFAKARNKKEGVPDIPFIPIEPSEKDDLKAKRKKGKVKKKKWGDDEDLGGDTVGQKKKKSIVEGKDLYEQGFPTKKARKKDSKSKQKAKIQQKTQITVPKAIKRRIKIDETIDLSELAKRMSIKANEMIQKLMGMGIMVTVNQTIDFDTAALVAAEFDYEVEKAAVAEDMLLHAHEADAPDSLIPRSPVVTIMGHVDHGKTSLLDVIRKSKITTGEAGGITQHIGAYSVQTPNGGFVTFLDTPGHAAFTSMRSRGAKITDIVVLVVAADDGVMPQTVEAINHSKAAGVPVVVAINKIDKPDADPDRVMRELSDHGLLSEEWGGDVIFAKVSAKKREGIDELLDLILLQAEVLELKANPNRLAKGHVVEARLDAGRGPVATVLVQQGTLKVGQPVVCGLHSGKIRLVTDDMGKIIDTAGPSTPVEIVGLSGVPEAGDEFVALASEKDAKNISESRMQKERAKELAKKSRANLEKLFANMGSGQVKQLKLIIKADVHGSLEALNDSLLKLSQEEVDIKIVHSGTGAINESDVSLAAVSDAIIIGFNVRPTPKVREMAKDENVDMRFYDIIYNVINDIKTALTGLMPSTFHEIIIGRAEVRDIFVIPGKGTIAGSFVVDGKVARGEKIRVLRDGVIKCDSSLSSLRRFKDDAKEVTQGYECGIGIERFNDIKVNDIIECYQIEERKASIDSLKESTPLPEDQ
ncbi:MAG: translation initiation factor IF-2 [Desulfamplus sp.]|nr:translation initiation factor IF-2 [Desulfamplus sp.]